VNRMALLRRGNVNWLCRKADPFAGMRGIAELEAEVERLTTLHASEHQARRAAENEVERMRQAERDTLIELRRLGYAPTDDSLEAWTRRRRNV
jgi:hypothetical protein